MKNYDKFQLPLGNDLPLTVYLFRYENGELVTVPYVEFNSLDIYFGQHTLECAIEDKSKVEYVFENNRIRFTIPAQSFPRLGNYSIWLVGVWQGRKVSSNYINWVEVVPQSINTYTFQHTITDDVVMPNAVFLPSGLTQGEIDSLARQWEELIRSVNVTDYEQTLAKIEVLIGQLEALKKRIAAVENEYLTLQADYTNLQSQLYDLESELQVALNFVNKFPLSLQDSTTGFKISSVKSDETLSVSKGHIKTKNFDSLAFTSRFNHFTIRQQSRYYGDSPLPNYGNSYSLYEYGQLPDVGVLSLSLINDRLVVVFNDVTYQILDKDTLLPLSDRKSFPVNVNSNYYGWACNPLISSYAGYRNMLLVSSYSGSKGADIYSLDLASNTLVHRQKIVISDELLSDSKFGLGNTAFVSIEDQLFSLVYKENNVNLSGNNKLCLCRFSLPGVSAGSEVVLDVSSVAANYEVSLPAFGDLILDSYNLILSNRAKSLSGTLDISTIDSTTGSASTALLTEFSESTPRGLFIDGRALFISFEDSLTLYKITF